MPQGAYCGNCEMHLSTIHNLQSKLSASEEALKATEAWRIELHQCLSAETTAKFEWKQRAEAAEKLIEDSRKQEPVGYLYDDEFHEVRPPASFPEIPHIKLYKQPPIPPELSEVMRERDELKKDAGRLSWLEDQYGLHRETEITYVVDGYEIEFTYDGNPTDGKTYHGENLREAIDKAMLSASPTYKEQP